MTAALDDAVGLVNGQRSSAVKVRFARRILASAAEGERHPVELRISAFLGAADDDCTGFAVALNAAVQRVDRSNKLNKNNKIGMSSYLNDEL
jgi:hypothetical protein